MKKPENECNWAAKVCEGNDSPEDVEKVRALLDVDRKVLDGPELMVVP